jgi:hypothetical protein
MWAASAQRRLNFQSTLGILSGVPAPSEPCDGALTTLRRGRMTKPSAAAGRLTMSRVHRPNSARKVASLSPMESQLLKSLNRKAWGQGPSDMQESIAKVFNDAAIAFIPAISIGLN